MKMTMIRSLVAAVLFLPSIALVSAPAARAAEAPSGSPAAMALPAPAAELGQLTFFEGNWTCKGMADASPFGPAHATQATVRMRREFGGFWTTGRYEEKKTAENPHPMTFQFILEIGRAHV